MPIGNKHCSVKDSVGLAFVSYLSTSILLLSPPLLLQVKGVMQTSICSMHFNAQVSPHNSITVEAVLASPPPQKALSKRLDSHIFQSLLSSSSSVSKARILSFSAPPSRFLTLCCSFPGLDLVRWQLSGG